MSFIKHLQRLGIVYDANGVPGGGQSRKDLMAMTDEKITGTLEEPEGGDEPDPKEAEKPKAKEDPQPNPDPEEEEDEPVIEEDDEPVDEDDPSDDDDLEEEEDEKPKEEFYYDPEKHVEGKPAHTNKFKTREQAEYAAVQKAELVKNVLDKMDEAGIDRGAIPLPEVLNGSIDSLDTLTNLQNIVAMDDDALHSWLDDSDRFRQRLDGRMDRKQKEQKARQVTSEFEKLQVETFDDLKKLIDPTVISENRDKFADVDRATEFVNSKIDDKVKSELEQEREDLEKWIDDIDSGEIKMSIREFDKEKQRRVNSIQQKEQEIRSQYDPLVDKMQKLHELSQEVDGQKELTPKEKAKKTWSNFSEWQEDRAGDIPLLEDTPEAKAELIAMKNWAIQNIDNLHEHPSKWNEAVSGWNDFKNKIRSKRQKSELENEKPGKKGDKSDTDDDIPNPGDQDKLKKNKDEGTRFVRDSMKKLMELTDATVGA